MSKNELKGEQIRDILMNGTTSLIPGGAYLRGVLDFRQDLKQRRVIHFLEFFLGEVNKISGKSEEEILNASSTEEFIDIFDLIIEKIHQTKSKQKAKRFSYLLIQQLIDPLPDYFMLKMIDLLHRLNDIQFYMLHKISRKRSSGVRCSPSFFSLFGEIDDKDYDFYNISLTPETEVKVHNSELEIYFNDLISLGLVNCENKIQLKAFANRRPDELPKVDAKEEYRISKSGLSFLELMSDSPNKTA